jgi:hypothetical protein
MTERTDYTIDTSQLFADKEFLARVLSLWHFGLAADAYCVCSNCDGSHYSSDGEDQIGPLDTEPDPYDPQSVYFPVRSTTYPSPTSCAVAAARMAAALAASPAMLTMCRGAAAILSAVSAVHSRHPRR